MRRVILIIALILASSIMAQIPVHTREQNVRDFVSGFFGSLNNAANFTVDDACVGQETKDNILDMLEAFHNKDIAKAKADIQKIMSITMDSCPVEEVKNYVNQKFDALLHGYYFENAKHNILAINKIIGAEYFNKNRNAHSIGSACGNIEKLLIFKQRKMLTFLSLAMEAELPTMPKFEMDLAGFEQFLKGVLEGVSSVPFDKNVCYSFPIDIKIDTVKDIFERLYKSIKERSVTEFYQVVNDMLAILNKLKNSNEHCNVPGLIKAIEAYHISYAGLAKLVYNITSNIGAYYHNIKDAIHYFGAHDWENAGSATGKIVSTLLSWHTS